MSNIGDPGTQRPKHVKLLLAGNVMTVVVNSSRENVRASSRAGGEQKQQQQEYSKYN